jgi:predicted nucleic acid-binding protein
MVAYLDSSVLLRHILLGEISIKHALEFPRIVSSELIEIECRRVLYRYRLAGELQDEGFAEAAERLNRILDGIDVLELTGPIKKRATDAFPVIIGTLDALHISTALMLAESQDELSLFTRSGYEPLRKKPWPSRGALLTFPGGGQLGQVDDNHLYRGSEEIIVHKLVWGMRKTSHPDGEK